MKNCFPALLVLLLAVAPAYAQLRPLEPVSLHGFSGHVIHTDLGIGIYSDQRASLAGSRGTLTEAGNFHVTIRSGRVVMEMGGTFQRLFRERQILEQPLGDATIATNGRRHDAGDYRVAAVFRLTPDRSATLAALRFGTRLPTTDNRVGLDRDATDFFATLAARHAFGSLAIATEAGLSINGTRKTTYEQSDVLVYAVSAEFRAGVLTPFVMALGQEDLHDWVAVRGNEDLGEIRAGVRSAGKWWVSAAFVSGYREYSPGTGLQVSLGTSFGAR